MAHRPNHPIPPAAARRAQENASVDESGCWLSNYSIKGGKGYATVGARIDGKEYTFLAHRASWVHSNGQIPDGMVIDHICRTRHCVNPDHLRLLTLERNTQLRLGKDFPEGTCGWGHDDSNMRTVTWSGRTQRMCNECLRERNAYLTEIRRGIRLLEIAYGLGGHEAKRTYPAMIAEREARVAAVAAARIAASTDTERADRG